MELNSFYSCGDRQAKGHESLARCGRRTASATDLWRSLSHSRRRWQRRRFCHHWKFDVQTEAYGYAKFAYQSTQRRRRNHRQSICVAGRCAVLPRFSKHWRRWHSSGIRQRRIARANTFVSSVVRRHYFSGGAFVILSAIYGLRPAHWSLATINYTTCEVHHLAFHTRLFPRFPVLQFGAAFSSLAFSAPPP